MKIRLSLYHQISTLGCIALLFLSSYTLQAQDWKELDTDALFQLARTEAFEGKRETAREKLNHILQQKPDYAEVKVFLARTYSWDGQYTQSIELTKEVLSQDGQYIDAYNALFDAYYWQDQYTNALEIVENGLKFAPNEESLLLKKAKALVALEQLEEANLTLDQLFRVNPSQEEGKALQKSIASKQMIYTASARVGVELYDVVYDPAYNASAQLARANKWGTSLLRLNYANRFNTTGYQGEIDLYPSLGKNMYGYFNYGYSNSILFANHAAGAEAFRILPKSWEASLGVRYLYFDANSDVFIYTGSISKYYRSWWFSFRPFLTPDQDTGLSYSLGGNVRKYFGATASFIGANARIGYSPDRVIQTIPTNDDIYTLKTQSVGLDYQQQLNNRWRLLGNLAYTRQELTFDLGNYVNIWSISVGANYNFKLKK